MAVNVFPDDYELISFFEVEPDVLDADIPWFYNTLTFQKQCADELLYCTFSPAYGDIDLTLSRDQKAKITLNLHNIKSIEILKDSNGEHLKATFHPDTLLKDFLLTLKPEISIIWGTSLD
jgi:hypothetical protein